MTWPRAALLLGTLGVVVALGAWWAGDAATDPPVAAATRPGGTFVRSDEVVPAPADAGVGRVSGQVLGPDGGPVAGAEVLVFLGPAPTEGLECELCHQDVLGCSAPRTVTQVLEGLRAGHLRRPAPAARTVTDANGAFVLEEAPLSRELTVLAAEGAATGETRLEPLLLALVPRGAPGGFAVTVRDLRGAAVSGAKVTVYDERTGALSTHLASGAGALTLPSTAAEAWIAVEAEGYQPAAGRGQAEFVLSPPLALTVRTTMGGRPVDAEVTLDAHLPPGPLRTRDGVLRIEGLAPGLLTVRAATAELRAPEQMLELQQVETTVTFDLLRGARALVTVVTETGEPLESVDATMTHVLADLTVDATAEKGAVLTLGPVPEGEYQLSVSAPGRVAAARTLDLAPGDNVVEVTLRAATMIKGRVVDPRGAPVEDAHVEVVDGDLDLAESFTGEEGRFEIELERAGTFKVLASHALVGRAEQLVTTDGPAVTLALRQLGVIEVEVVDFDGQPAAPDFVLHGELGAVTAVATAEGGNVGRCAGLKPGRYVLSLEAPDRLSVERAVELGPDQVLRLHVRLDEGAAVSGRAVGADGEGWSRVSVFPASGGASAQTDEAGRFELRGLVPGKLSLVAYSPDSAPGASVSVDVTAPARDVVLSFPRARHVKGRAVDERHAPLAGVNVEDGAVTGPDGRFEADSQSGDLNLSAAGYLTVTLESVGEDVGDVVMHRAPVLEGEVVDEAGQAVPGALVRVADSMESASTDSRGHFAIELEEDAELQVVASRGGRFARGAGRAGRWLRLALARGTLVSGRVLGAGGRGQPTFVSVSDPSSVLVADEIATDGEGRFQLALAPGVWTFEARSERLARAWNVQGERMEIVLGEDPGSCGVVVSAPEPILSFSLVPASAGEDAMSSVVAGSIDFSGRREERTLLGRSVPCGDYLAIARFERGYLRQPLALRAKAQPLVLDPGRLVEGEGRSPGEE